LAHKSTPAAAKTATVQVASDNIRLIATLERQALHDRTALDRVTDAITSTAGSPIFVIAHAAWFTVWIGLNITGHQFDPFPFNLLTLIVSLEAIFLTGFVLMTQNRMTRQADRRAHLDLQVNMLAEQELTTMLQMLTALCEHAGVPRATHDTRVAQLSKETDIHTIADAIDRELVDERANH
jgi:uncharacterized membrane protein